MLETIRTLLTRVRGSNVTQSLSNDGHKYAVVGVVFALSLVFSYQALRRAVHTQDLIAGSVLHLAPRNVHTEAPGTGNERGVLGKVGGRSGSEVVPDVPQERQPYLPPEATVTITPKDPKKKLSDVVNVKVTGTYGFTLEPGLDLSVITPGIGLDLRWFYVEKIGTEIGLERYFGPYNIFSPTAGLSYRLDSFRALRNTELKLSYAPLLQFPVTVSVRVGF